MKFKLTVHKGYQIILLLEETYINKKLILMTNNKLERSLLQYLKNN